MNRVQTEQTIALAVRKIELRDLESARKILESVPIEFQDSKFHNMVGFVYQGLHRLDDAENQYRIAIDLKGSSQLASQVWSNLAVVLKLKVKPIEAEEACNSSLKLNSRNTVAHEILGDLRYDAGRYADAAKLYEELLLESPHNYQALFKLGVSYSHMGLNDRAIAVYRKCIVNAPNWATPWFNLGTIYFAYNNYEKAEQCLKESLKRDQNDPDIWRKLGELYTRTDRIPDAERNLKKAQELNHPDERIVKAIEELNALKDRPPDSGKSFWNEEVARVATGPYLHLSPSSTISDEDFLRLMGSFIIKRSTDKVDYCEKIRRALSDFRKFSNKKKVEIFPDGVATGESDNSLSLDGFNLSLMLKSHFDGFLGQIYYGKMIFDFQSQTVSGFTHPDYFAIINKLLGVVQTEITEPVMIPGVLKLMEVLGEFLGFRIQKKDSGAQNPLFRVSIDEKTLQRVRSLAQVREDTKTRGKILYIDGKEYIHQLIQDVMAIRGLEGMIGNFLRQNEPIFAKA